MGLESPGGGRGEKGSADRAETDGPVHRPVMVEQVLELLDPQPGHLVLDLTVGAGGHATRVLGRTGNNGRLIGIDRDPAILEVARATLAPFSDRVILKQGLSDSLDQILRGLGESSVDAILMDLGVSSLQLDDAARGFSFREDAPLDMRMTPGKGKTALNLLQELDAPALEDILRRFGEEPRARVIAERLHDLCQRRPPRRTSELAAFIETLSPRRPVGRGKPRGGIHPATRVFQALRIAVNDELGVLERTLPKAVRALRPGGRIAVIAFHSLEDRIVKHFFHEGERRGRLIRLTKKPWRPLEDEVAENRRSRSALLRAAVKTEEIA